MFGWKIEKWQGPVDYWLAATGEKVEPGIDGAIMGLGGPAKSTVNTIEVPSLEEYLNKVAAAGGKRVTKQETIPGVGIFCYCKDTEGNLFGLLESERR